MAGGTNERASSGHNGPDHGVIAADGLARIEWVEQHSPVMRSLVRGTLGDGSLKGKRIAVVVHPEAKTTLPHDCVLANAGHHGLEVDVDALGEIADHESVSAPGVHTFALGRRDIHVLSRGALVNFAGGSGHPVEIMDLTFAVKGLGAHHLVNTPMEAGVHILPKHVDDSIAAAKLASLGIALPRVRHEQEDDITQWIERIAL